MHYCYIAMFDNFDLSSTSDVIPCPSTGEDPRDNIPMKFFLPDQTKIALWICSTLEDVIDLGCYD